MSDKVTMRSPEGETREVEATPEVLTPLMAAGWHQHQSVPAAQAVAKVQDVVRETKTDGEY